MKEAQYIGHDYVGVDHLLLGVLREGESRFCKILNGYGLDLQEARRRVLSTEDDEKKEIDGIRDTALAKLTDEEKCVLLGSTFLFPQKTSPA